MEDNKKLTEEEQAIEDSREFIKSTKSFIKKVVIGFIVINLIVFLTVVSKQSFGKDNIKAKLLFSTSATVNIVYLIPTEQIFGWDSLISKPFSSLRNFLFDKGVENLPKGDGEKYSWWFVIKYSEFQKVVAPVISKYSIDREYLPDDKIAKLEKLTDEIYKQIEPFAKSKINDKKLRERKLNTINAIIFGYYNDRYILMSRTNGELSFQPQEMYKFEKLLNIYLALKKYSEKNEKDSYDYFFTKTRRAMYDPLILHKLSQTVIDSKILNNKFDCNDPYLKILGSSFDELETEWRGLTKSVVDSDNLVWATALTPFDEKIVIACPNIKELEVLKEGIEKSEHKKITEIDEKEIDEFFNKIRRKYEVR